jgi:type IV pilus assembly protein PilC
MAEFLVKMADERGRVMERAESAPTADELRDRFSKQGLSVVSIKERGLLSGGQVNLRRRKIKHQDWVVFNQQLYTLIKAGLPIPTALELLERQQKNAYFKAILGDVRQRVRSGEVLSAAFAAQDAVSRIYATTLVAGEKSGNLDEVLARYINFEKTALSVRKKLLISLIYPALLITAVLFILVFLVTFVVPRFAALYQDLGAELPAITVFILSFGVGVQKYAWLIFGSLVVLVLTLQRWRRSRAGQERIDRVRLRMPLLGQIWLKYQVSMFCRTLATLLAGGLPLVPALETAGESMESRTVANSVVAAAERVKEGQPLAKCLEETRRFPAMAIEMLAVGESTGSMREMLISVADFYEEDVQNAVTAAMALIEPILLIIVAVFVITILLALYLPLFSLGASGGLQR